MIQIDEARIRDHLGEMLRRTVEEALNAMLESGRYTSLTELAEVEKIGKSYRCRVLRLTLLAPNIVEATLDGRQLRG